MNIDNYERLFIDKNIKVSPNSEKIILDILLLFNNCLKKDLKSVNSATRSDGLINLIDLMNRSKSYGLLYELWDKQFGKTCERFNFSKENLVYIFLPIFLQEIEGPLKRQLLMLNYLLELDKGKKVVWSDYAYKRTVPKKKHKFIWDIINDGLTLSDSYPEIRNIFSGLIVDNNKPYINLVRRCIAHSDYKINKNNNDLTIIFPNHDKDFILSFNQFCGIMTMTFDLISILHTAFHLGIRRKDLALN
jgi:hypothetical protein